MRRNKVAVYGGLDRSVGCGDGRQAGWGTEVMWGMDGGCKPGAEVRLVQVCKWGSWGVGCGQELEVTGACEATGELHGREARLEDCKWEEPCAREVGLTRACRR